MSCGSNSEGVLGHDAFDPSDKKKRAKRLSFVTHMGEVGRVVQISCGNSHNLIMDDKAQIFGWGSNQFHQILPSQEHDPKEKTSRLASTQEQAAARMGGRLGDWRRRYEAFK